MGSHYQKLNDFRFIWGKWRWAFRLTLSLVLWLYHLARIYSWVPGQELAESKVKCLVQVPFPSWGTTSNDLPMQEGNLDTFLLQFKTLHCYSLLSCLWDWLKGITFLFSSSCCPHSLTSTVQRTLLKKLSLCKYPAQSVSPEI